MGIAFLNIPTTKKLISNEIQGTGSNTFCRWLGYHLRQWIELPHKKMYAWPQGTSTIIIVYFKGEVNFANDYYTSLNF